MIDLPHEELLTGYLDGELTSEERELVEELLRNSAEARQLLEELRALRESIRALPRYQISPGQPADAFAQRILQRAEREMLVAGTAIAATEESATDKASPQRTEQAGPHSSTEPAERTHPIYPADVSTFSGGSGWKKLLAAAAVLAAAITLMVTGPAQRGPATSTVAMHSRAAEEADAAIAAGELANAGWLEEAPMTRGGGIAASSVPFAAPEATTMTAPAMPAIVAPQTRGVPEHEFVPPPDASFTPGSTARHRVGPQRFGAAPPPAAEPEVQAFSRPQDPTTFSAAGAAMTAGNAARMPATPLVNTDDVREAQLGREAGPSLVVHVQLTEDAWQSGQFAELLNRRHIAWQQSMPTADELKSRTGKAQDVIRGQDAAKGNQAANLHVVYASGPAPRMQELLSDLQSAAAQGSGVVALAVASPDAPYDRAGDFVVNSVRSFTTDRLNRPLWERSQERKLGTGESTEVAPPFSPLDPQAIAAADRQRHSLHDKGTEKSLQSKRDVEPLAVDRQAFASGRGAGGSTSPQQARAIRLEAAGVESLAQLRSSAAAADTFQAQAASGAAASAIPEVAQAHMPQARSAPLPAEAATASAKQGVSSANAGNAANELKPTTEALFVIQIVPSPGK